ncbi:T9SS type A sorting domain-containing protein [Larkinella bovis]|uniref:T9SS type A sorting domain-containing protein n=1 Tax=Larkinella bovis TaxID=683041 RepID=A0ABW0IMF7_9BACT
MNPFLRILSLAVLFLGLLKPAGAQTVYYQSFASGLGTWTSSNTTAITSNTTSASSGYTTPIMASGGFNLSFGECGGNAEHSVTSSAISTIGRTNLMVGFGRRRTASFGPQVVQFEFSTNGGTSWTTISSDVSSTATTVWGLSIFNLPAAAENQASLLFRFRYTPPPGAACGTSFRIDDFTVNENNTLPVELVSFRGTADRSGNRLVWETAWERGASHFVVERSADARVFGDIGQLSATGNATSGQSYAFMDSEPLPETSYYRLRQVDLDGSVRHSKLIPVSRAADEWMIYNPASNREIRLKASSTAADPASLWLYTVSGQFVPFQLLQHSPTDWLIRPAVPLQAGLYILQVGQTPQHRTLRVLVR